MYEKGIDLKTNICIWEDNIILCTWKDKYMHLERPIYALVKTIYALVRTSIYNCENKYF